jgi:type I restriction enzyme S subunit
MNKVNSQNWQIKKLDDACNVAYGTRVVNKRDGGSIFPVYGGGGATFFMDEYNREDCMVVARFAMSEKCTRFVSGKFFLNDSGLTVLPKSNKEILQEFLDYQLISLNNHIYSLARGSAQKNLDLPAFRKIKISYPESLFEQHRIVKILDEVFDKTAQAKTNAEKNLQNAKELFESYLQGVFVNPEDDWKEKSLAEVCEIKSKLVDPRKSEFIELIHIGAGNMITKSEKLVGLKTSKEEKLISGKFLFDKSMVLYSKIRPYLMKVIRPKFEGLCSADIYPLSPIPDKITRDFLFHLLLTQKFTQYAIKGSGRAGMPKVNREHLFAFNFFLPPISKQKSIVKKLDALSVETKKLEVIYKQKLADLEELKKSILRRAFNGDL